MNLQLQKLYDIAKKPERTVVGLMSGTSLDGLDIAVCKIKGSGRATELELCHFNTIPYDTDFTDLIRRVFARDLIKQADLSGLNVLVARKHAELVRAALAEWNLYAEQVDLIASHGQTVFHAPAGTSSLYPNNTLQIGDGDHIAYSTGILTISDFRQKHIAAGGQGAPLAVYGDYLLFSDTKEDRILLNLGGIGNFTYLPSWKAQEQGFQVFSTDTGPANTLLNQYVQKHLGLSMDRDGQIASQGRILDDLLEALCGDQFFTSGYPRTTGPELFNLNYLTAALSSTAVQDPSHEDLLATLTEFSALTITDSIKEFATRLPEEIEVQVYASGGGVDNPVLMHAIRQYLQRLQIKTHRFEVLGLLPEAKEAALFAVLANELLVGNPMDVAGFEGAPAVSMGKISLP